MSDRTPPDQTLDARGLLCPLPVLKTRKALRSLSPGQTLGVDCTDPASVIDMPAFCQESGHALIASERSGTHSGEKLFHFTIRRA